MIGFDKQILGCLVRDVQTGVSLGWVKTMVVDPAGEQVVELLVDPAARLQGNAGVEGGERLIGRSLFDPAGRFLGEIIDVVIGTHTGKVQGLVVERETGSQDLVPAYRGLMWEDDHWSLLEETPTMSTTFFPPTGEEAYGREDYTNDWMVGQRATVRLCDRRGHVIVERGQRITSGMVEQASRAGVLHNLEAEFH